MSTASPSMVERAQPVRAVSRILGTNVVDYALRFAASVLIARALGPSDKGVLTFATLVVGWLTMFGNFSLADATVYLVGRRSFNVAEALGANLIFCLGAGLLYATGSWLVVTQQWISWPTPQVEVFLLLLTTVPLALLQGNLTAIVQGAQRFSAYAVVVVLRSAGLLVAVLLALWLAADPLTGIVWALVGASLFSVLTLAGYLTWLGGWRLRFSGDFLRQALPYGLRGHASVVLQNIILRLDQLVLGAVLAPVHLGWYSIAVSLSELPRLLPDSVGVVLFPKVADDPSRAGVHAAQACRVTLALMGLATAGLLAIGPVFIRFVYGSAFSPAYEPLVWLAPSIVFLAMTKILSKYLYGMGRPHWVILSTGVSAAITAILIYPLVTHWGIVGAAVTSTLAYTWSKSRVS